MKSEIKPGVIIAIIAVVVVLIAIFFVVGSGGVGGSEKLDIKKIDPKILRDADPPRRGQPGYQERTNG